MRPGNGRLRLAEDPSYSQIGVAHVAAAHPGFDPRPWQRSQRALYAQDYKYIAGSDGRSALFDLAADPLEERDLRVSEPETARRMAASLSHTTRGLDRCDAGAAEESPPMSREQCEMLKGLGYVDDCEQPAP